MRAWSFVVVAAAAALFADLSLPLGAAVGIPYIGVVLLSWWLNSFLCLIVIAALCSLLTAAGYFYDLPPADDWIALANRGFAILAIWLTALFLLHARMERVGQPRLQSTLKRGAPQGNRAVAGERAESRDALSGSEAQLRAVFDTVVDALIITDAYGIVRDCNPSCCRMFGYRAVDLIGRNVSILMEPPFSQDHDGYLRRYREGGEARIIGTSREVAALRRDGTLFPVELSVGEVLCGETQLFVGVMRDNSERKATIEALRRQALIFEQMSDGVIVTDLEGRISDWNPAAERMFGYARQEVLHSTPSILHHPAEAEELRLEIVERINRTGEWRGEINFVRKDGREGVCETHVLPLYDVSGEVIARIGVNRDLTERKEAEKAQMALQQQVYQAQKIDALGNLLGGIAHDFNNALLPIIGLTELTAPLLPKESKERTNLQKVLDAAYHAQDLVRQLLTFSRQDPPDRRRVDIAEIVHDAIRFLRAGLPSTIEMIEQLDNTIGFVFADATQIRQVIVNLATNARDAMIQSGGVLRIEISAIELATEKLANLQPGPYFRIDVTDTGRGMDEATIERIFEPFFTTKPANKGHGLGLTVAFGIVRGHNGTITVASEVGRGTQFSVYLPRAGDETPGAGGE